jgi:hypothetical protein
MRIPRRKRRRLDWPDALPSGWFAAWLGMLLGFCHIMFPVPADEVPAGIHWPTTFGASCDGGMLRLSLPPLHPGTIGQESWDWVYKTPAALDTLKCWQDITFTGEAITDFMAFATAIQSVKLVEADWNDTGGVRIYFQPQATFSSLVAMLDVLPKLNQKRYWFAINDEPLILYVIHSKGAPSPVQPLLL